MPGWVRCHDDVFASFLKQGFPFLIMLLLVFCFTRDGIVSTILRVCDWYFAHERNGFKINEKKNRKHNQNTFGLAWNGHPFLCTVIQRQLCVCVSGSVKYHHYVYWNPSISYVKFGRSKSLSNFFLFLKCSIFSVGTHRETFSKSS